MIRVGPLAAGGMPTPVVHGMDVTVGKSIRIEGSVLAGLRTRDESSIPTRQERSSDYFGSTMTRNWVNPTDHALQLGWSGRTVAMS